MNEAQSYTLHIDGPLFRRQRELLLRLADAIRHRYGPRSVLIPGDRFRARGGPVYVTASGAKIHLGDRGLFIFRRYCIEGAAKWIEAYRADGGTAILWVGKPRRSPTVPNLLRKPYRISGKVGDPRPARRR